MIKQTFFAFSIGLGAALVLSGTARGQEARCAKHAAVVGQLQQRYGEARENIGLASNNTIIEVFSSAKTGTWTIVVTRPNGVSCLLAAGESWQVRSDPLPEPGTDS